MNLDIDRPESINKIKQINSESKNRKNRNESYKPIDECKLESVSVIKIYFLSRGHNAWNGIWSLKYIRGESIFSNLRDAEEEAESLRRQGYVFYIDELPALLFEFELGYQIIAVEINTIEPMCLLNTEMIKLYFNHININEINGKLIRKIFDAAFTGFLNFWKSVYKSYNSIILTYAINYNRFEKIEQETKLFRYISKSHGPNYMLEWSKKPNNVTLECIRSSSNFFRSLTNK